MPDPTFPRNASLNIQRAANGFVVAIAPDPRRDSNIVRANDVMVFNDFGHTDAAPGSCLAAFLRDHFDKPEDAPL